MIKAGDESVFLLYPAFNQVSQANHGSDKCLSSGTPRAEAELAMGICAY